VGEVRLQQRPTKARERRAHLEKKSSAAQEVGAAAVEHEGVTDEGQPMVKVEEQVELPVVDVGQQHHCAFEHEEARCCSHCEVTDWSPSVYDVFNEFCVFEKRPGADHHGEEAECAADDGKVPEHFLLPAEISIRGENP